jgi:hypothetical protein
VSSIVRQRRYVSARAGTYPPPLLPRRGEPNASPAPHADRESHDLGEEIDASLAAASPPAVEPTAAEGRNSEAGTPLGFDASPALPGEDAGAGVERPSAAPEVPEPGEEPIDDRGGIAATPEPSKRPRSPVTGMIIGGVVGAAVGALAGLVLLALTQGGGSLAERVVQPAAIVEQLADPLALWNGVSDWLIRMSAILVGGGFLLLGVGWGGRIGSRRRS